MKTTQIINMWSGPRNISTTMMYAFARRPDTRVLDEPLYGYYLNNTEASLFHPKAEEIVNQMEVRGNIVLENILQNKDAEILFCKQMSHHFIDLDESYLKNTNHFFLVRHPLDVIVSFSKVIEKPSLTDIGYKDQISILHRVLDAGHKPIVIDSVEILKNPVDSLKALCKALRIKYYDKMLTWEQGPKPYDGIWAEYWYKNVHTTSGFLPYKKQEKSIPQSLRPLLDEALPYYEELISYSI